MSTLKATTTSVRLPPELRQRLEDTARRLGRGKNWIVVRALEEYLAKGHDRAFIEEARRQSERASEGVT
ncbi:MAG: CopG family ribbon-helix-helix protein, partial [Actinomycetota bacterium]